MVYTGMKGGVLNILYGLLPIIYNNNNIDNNNNNKNQM